VELIPITAHIFLVPGAAAGRFPFSHSILVDSSPVTLIDAGCGHGSLAELMEICDVEQVIISHSHPHHTAGCHLLEGRPIFIPEMAADTFGDKETLAERFAEPGGLARTFRAYITGAMGYEDTPHTDTYHEGYTFDLSGMRFVAVHTPGHTWDHMCLFEATHGILFSFDIDLSWFGPFYGHRESDIAQFRSSMQKIMDLEPRTVVSSHEGIIRDHIQQRLQRYDDVFDARHGAIRALVEARPRTLEELVAHSPIYRGHLHAPPLLRYWEGQMILKHLDLLVSQGRVVRNGQGFYRAV
jgi:glyoxylase-like metal-dependent hydrolase (beta-lactamase superfamily II)